MQKNIQELAENFWWTGDPWANDLWKELDPWLWEDLAHNPTAMLNEIDWTNVSDEWKAKAQSLLKRYNKHVQKPSEILVQLFL